MSKAWKNPDAITAEELNSILDGSATLRWLLAEARWYATSIATAWVDEEGVSPHTGLRHGGGETDTSLWHDEAAEWVPEWIRLRP